MNDISFLDILKEYEPILLNQYNYIEDIEKAESSLHEFLKQSWVINNPDPFVDGWHLHAISEHLEALMKREIKNLIVNVPPRSSKTSLISIDLPAWWWLHDPTERFIYASHSHTISLKDSVACRRLIQSKWYQERWGRMYNLLKDDNQKTRFSNDKGGYRIATSVGSNITGEGGSVQVCLPYDTLISTDRGRIMIGEIVHDKLPVKVLAYNHDYDVTDKYEIQSRTAYKEIEAYESNGQKEVIEIELEDRTVECTEDHPIYVKGIGYIEARYLKEGDVVWTI